MICGDTSALSGVEILKAAFQHHFPHCRLDKGLPSHSPIAVSLVNRWWRRLALSVPQIWTCIHLTVHQPNDEAFCDVAATYLTRSADLPLSIFFSCYTNDYDTHYKYTGEWPDFEAVVWPRFRRALRMLLDHRTRWKHLAVHVLHEEAVALLLFQMSLQVFPSLEYFGISLWKEDDISPEEAIFDFMAPKLAQIHTCRIDFTHFQTHQKQHQYHPLNNIREIMLTDNCLCPIQFLRMLALTSTTLETLVLSQISFGFPSEDAGEPPSFISLPRLHTLYLDEVVDEHDTAVPITTTVYRSAPSISKIRMSDHCDLLARVLDGRVSFAAVRSLECASLFTETGQEPNGTFLLSFPAIHTASLDESEIIVGKVLEEAMRIDNAAGCCAAWPALQTLTVGERASHNLASFVEHRARLGSPLQSVRILASPLAPDEPNAQRLQELSVHLQPQVVRRHARIPFVAWDYDADKPSILPWNGSFDVPDQFPIA